MKTCPHCKSISVPPYGPEDASILIIAESPGDAEMQYGKPFVGPAGKVLRDELQAVGIDLRECRLAHMWIHPKNENQSCKDLSIRVMRKEVEGRKGVLLLGSEASYYFTHYKVSDIIGLRVEDLVEFVSLPLVICAPNPISLFQTTSTVGEFRLALKNFAKYMEVEND